MVINNPVVNDNNIEYDDICHWNRDSEMAVDAEWQARVKRLLKAELKRRDVSYKQLAERLGEMGIQESERNINNKISRGGFTAVFFMQCLVAIGVKTLNLGEE